jgi:glucuronoarabinoxylan endo-1,4-beta-xylanase
MKGSAAAIAIASGALCAIAPAQSVTQFTVDASERHQTIEGWGAMFDPLSQQVTQLFAQPSFAARLRDDLGISAARIEIQPYIHEVEDLNPNVIDWTKFNFSWLNAAGNLVAAMNNGHPHAVKPLLVFWTPPAWMKTNNDIAGGGNLRVDRYPHFGKFCAATCIAFQNYFGEPVYALSIQNEPFFSEPYLSCVYSQQQYRDTCHAVSDAMDHFGVTTKLFGSEDVGTEPPRWMSYVTALQGDTTAWDRMKALAIHHYPWDPATGDDTSAGAWASLRTQVQAATTKPLWQTERSGETPEWLGTPGHSKGGLYLARELHQAMKFGDVTLYLYWSICSNQPDEFGLMSLDQPTTKYYACKQFFRYIKPGSVRIGTSADTADTLASAYVNDAEHTMTVVVINQGSSPSSVHLDLTGGLAVSSFSAVRTSETESTVDLPAVPVTNGGADLILPQYSVVTLVGATTDAPPPPCYANCDGSTAAPILNVQDFTCFLGRFANGEAYANCDGSTAAPVLNVQDFTCFLQRFASGCP